MTTDAGARQDTTVTLPLASITLGERRREEYGDIDELAMSIGRYGMLHPIVVDDEYRIIAGGRRYIAAQRLGLDVVPARLYKGLTEAEKREIELEENLRRKDLTPFERSKTLIERVEVADEIIAAEKEREDPKAAGVLADSAKTPAARGGRPTKRAASQAAISERIDVPQRTISDAERHVETAETYPFMQRGEWAGSQVLGAREQLERLPDEERPEAAALLDQGGIPPKDAVAILANIAGMESAERSHIYALSRSHDSRDRSAALTRAARKPPMPDPRIHGLERVLAALAPCIGQFPHDPLTPRLKQVRRDLKSILAEIEEADRGVRTQDAAD